MADWATIASLATAGGTLVLAVATFSSVRVSRRSALATERMVLASLRPVLVSSRLQDPEIKVMWQDRHFVRLGGGRATVEDVDDVLYLAMALRNTGAGLAVMHGWRVTPTYDPMQSHPEPEEFRRLTRDLYVAPSDAGFWQAALRDPAEPEYTQIRQAIAEQEALTVDLLYGDHEGGQRMITRFGLIPTDGSLNWLCSTARHWNLDRPDPR